MLDPPTSPHMQSPRLQRHSAPLPTHQRSLNATPTSVTFRCVRSKARGWAFAIGFSILTSQLAMRATPDACAPALGPPQSSCTLLEVDSDVSVSRGEGWSAPQALEQTSLLGSVPSFAGSTSSVRSPPRPSITTPHIHDLNFLLRPCMLTAVVRAGVCGASSPHGAALPRWQCACKSCIILGFASHPSLGHCRHLS